MELTDLNSAGEKEAAQHFQKCCASQRWVQCMVKGRPYQSQAAVLKQANQCWENCFQEDYLEAFSAHPKIGDVEALRETSRSDQAQACKALAANEQSAVDQDYFTGFRPIYHYFFIAPQCESHQFQS